ncbi:hypothetical protein RNJ44_03527 [Nakaseomyces bracarensis]|uniref:Uncharacterized protein n=1 Tax=Nakaseomyces bracarensis TaxID=273131 RepID=A0ABR4NXB7_9SACH
MYMIDENEKYKCSVDLTNVNGIKSDIGKHRLTTLQDINQNKLQGKSRTTLVNIKNSSPGKKYGKQFNLESDIILPSDFEPPSPSLSKTLTYSNTKEKNIIMVGNEPLFLTIESPKLDIDIPPFYKRYEYDNRIAELGDIDALNIALCREMKGEIMFESELEYIEKKTILIKWYDYILFYGLGIDRIGYFELDYKRNEFLNAPWSYYTKNRIQNEYQEECSSSTNTNLSYSKDSEINYTSNRGGTSQRSRFSSLRELFSWV